MTSVSAQDLTKTHYCKAPNCTNEAASPVGRYSYCKEHQGTATVRRDTPIATVKTSAEQALRDLLSLAKSVDRAKAKAVKAQRAANAANRAATALADQYQDALAAAARGASAD